MFCYHLHVGMGQTRMEGMSVKWNQIKLMEEEQLDIDIKEDILSVKGAIEHYSLFRKVLIERKITKEVIRSIMLKIWKVDKNLQF